MPRKQVQSSEESSTNYVQILYIILTIGLWIGIFRTNASAFESLKSRDIPTMVKDIQSLKMMICAIYFLYLMSYFYTVYMPVSSALNGSSNFASVGLILSTMMCCAIYYLYGACTDKDCNLKEAEQYLNRIYMLMIVLVVVQAGTCVANYAMHRNKPEHGLNLTAQIMELLNSP